MTRLEWLFIIVGGILLAEGARAAHIASAHIDPPPIIHPLPFQEQDRLRVWCETIDGCHVPVGSVARFVAP